MRVEITTDAVEFRARAESFLRGDRLRHTVINTRLAEQLAGLEHTPRTTWYLTVHADSDASTCEIPVLGVAMCVDGEEICLGELPFGSAGWVAQALAEHVPGAVGVAGTARTVTEFAEHWHRLTGNDFRYGRGTRLYRLGVLRAPGSPGTARAMTRADLALCAQWLTDMSGRTIRPATLARAVDAGYWWLWERDGRPVGIAAHQLPTEGWATIGPVYTPPSERRRGVAGAVTAEIAGVLRAADLDVCVFADADDRTAHKVFQGIGFHPTHEFAHYRFVRRERR